MVSSRHEWVKIGTLELTQAHHFSVTEYMKGIASNLRVKVGKGNISASESDLSKVNLRHFNLFPKAPMGVCPVNIPVCVKSNYESVQHGSGMQRLDYLG